MLTIKEVSEKLKVSPQTIRIWIRNDLVPFGIFVKNGARCSYYIFEERLEKYLKGELHDSNNQSDAER